MMVITFVINYLNDYNCCIISKPLPDNTANDDEEEIEDTTMLIYSSVIVRAQRI